MARAYHPDAATVPTSTAEERKAANDSFARINAAYEKLTEQMRTRGSRGGVAAYVYQPAEGYGFQTPDYASFGSTWKSSVHDTNGGAAYTGYNDDGTPYDPYNAISIIWWPKL